MNNSVLNDEERKTFVNTSHLTRQDKEKKEVVLENEERNNKLSKEVKEVKEVKEIPGFDLTGPPQFTNSKKVNNDNIEVSII